MVQIISWLFKMTLNNLLINQWHFRRCNHLSCVWKESLQNVISEGRKQNTNSHMMAMRELKLPMLKHSRATSMKNSMTRALCFFFTGCEQNGEHFFKKNLR